MRVSHFAIHLRGETTRCHLLSDLGYLIYHDDRSTSGFGQFLGTEDACCRAVRATALERSGQLILLFCFVSHESLLSCCGIPVFRCISDLEIDKTSKHRKFHSFGIFWVFRRSCWVQLPSFTSFFFFFASHGPTGWIRFRKRAKNIPKA